MRRLELGLTLSCKNQLKKSNIISRLQMISYQDSKKALTRWMVCAFQILDVFSSKACTLDSHNQTSVDDSGDRARQNSRVLLDCNDS